jgi:hypothetical protein
LASNRTCLGIINNYFSQNDQSIKLPDDQVIHAVEIRLEVTQIGNQH